MIMLTIFRMYAVRRWDEDTVIKWLAVAMCLAMVGLVVMPAVSIRNIKAGLALAVYGYRNGNLPSLAGGLIATGKGIACWTW